jgi:hypothetical protein
MVRLVHVAGIDGREDSSDFVHSFQLTSSHRRSPRAMTTMGHSRARRMPEFDGAVVTRGSQRRSVGRKRNGIDAFLVPVEDES